MKGVKCTSLKELPLPATFSGLEAVARKTLEAMQASKNILVVGDYDADGVCSTAIMVRFFTAISYKNFDYIIPDRQKDGYGLSPRLLDRALKSGGRLGLRDFSLIITVDNGIGANIAAILCKQRGIELLITDHHVPTPPLPEASAIFDPKCDADFSDEICGAMVAWYLVKLLAKGMGRGAEANALLPLAGIASIADVMPMDGISRVVARASMRAIQGYGMGRSENGLNQNGFNKNELNQNQLNQNRFKQNELNQNGLNQNGLKENGLKESPSDPLNLAFLGAFKEGCYRCQPTYYALGFRLIPMINAAGRIDSPYAALDLLLATSLQTARECYAGLDAINTARKALLAEQFLLAKSCVILTPSIALAYNKDFHEGIIGIIASRLVELYNRPAFVLTDIHYEEVKGESSQAKADSDKMLKGSARSYGDFDLNTALAHIPFITYGGHAKALGLSLKKSDLESFIEACEFHLDSTSPNKEDFIPLNIVDISSAHLAALDSARPFGLGHVEPVFQSLGTLASITPLKSGFSRLAFKGCRLSALYFKEHSREDYELGSTLNLVYKIGEDGALLLEDIEKLD